MQTRLYFFMGYSSTEMIQKMATRYVQYQSNSWTDWTEFDVAETRVRIGILINRARAVGFVVHPSHAVWIAGTAPHGHGHDHAFPHSLRHAVRYASLAVGLAKMVAVTVGDSVVTIEGRLLDGASVLDVESLDLLQIAVVCSVDSQETSDDGELLGAVQLIAGTASVEILGASGVSVKSAAVRIALAIEAGMSRVDIG